MLKKAFLVTTALVLCVSTGFAAQQPHRPGERILARFMKLGIPVHVVHGFPVTVITTAKTGHPAAHVAQQFGRGVTFSNLDKDDPNAQFVSWYGATATAAKSCYYSGSYFSCFSEAGNNAIPITGLGYRARKITVPLFSLSGPSTEYNVGIYSATPSGLPGNELAGASTTASDTQYCCTGLRTVHVDIKLKAGQQYFVEVACGQNTGACYGGWDMESRDWSGDQTDYWHFKEHGSYNFGTGTHTSSFSSPWHLSTYLTVTGPAAKVY